MLRSEARQALGEDGLLRQPPQAERNYNWVQCRGASGIIALLRDAADDLKFIVARLIGATEITYARGLE